MKHLKFIASVIILLGIQACTSDPKTHDDPKKDPTPKKVVSVTFNKDSAYQYVAEQVAFGPRVPGTAAHQQTLQYLVNKLSEFCDTAYAMPGIHTDFYGKQHSIYNVMGRFNPKSKKRIVLAAHWDTRPQSDEDPVIKDKPADGANDGASGVGILIEIARQLKSLKPTQGVDIIFFDAEDGGESGGRPDSWCLGSQYWSSKAIDNGYSANAGILLDLVGAKNATFAFEGYSTEFNQNLMLEVWKTGQRLGYGSYFINNTGNMITDDHVYMTKFGGIPTIDIIHYDLKTSNQFPDHWHRQTDNMDAIDRNTLNAVGHTVLQVVMNRDI